jgi:hypothetical protein
MSGPLKKSMYEVMGCIPIDKPFMCSDLPSLPEGRKVNGGDLRRLYNEGFIRRVSMDKSCLWTWEATESLRRRRKA